MINTFLRDELAALIREHAVTPAAPAPKAAQPAYEWYAANDAALASVALDPSPRAVLLRQIKRLAHKYPWGITVVHRAMDCAGAATEDDLTLADLAALFEELQAYDDRVMHACDDADAPPAR